MDMAIAGGAELVVTFVALDMSILVGTEGLLLTGVGDL